MKNRIYAVLVLSLLVVVSSNIFGQQYNTAEYQAAHYAVNNPPLFYTKKAPDAGYASHTNKIATMKEAKELLYYINSIKNVHVVANRGVEKYYKNLERKLGVTFESGFLTEKRDALWDRGFTFVKAEEFVVYRKKVGAFSVAMWPNFFTIGNEEFNTHIGTFYLEEGPCMPLSVFTKGMGLPKKTPKPFTARADGYQIEYENIPGYYGNVQIGILPDGRHLSSQTTVSGDACVGYFWQ